MSASLASADYTCQDSAGVKTVSAGVKTVQTGAFRELDAAYYAAHKPEVDALVVQIETIANG